MQEQVKNVFENSSHMCYYSYMEGIRCKKCGSKRMVLKRVNLEEKRSFFREFISTFFYVFLGLLTLGLHFIFCAMNERRKRELGTEYYECEKCHFKMSTSETFCEPPKVKREELTEEEKEEIREIGRKPVNMKTWHLEREEAALRKRTQRQMDENDEKK